MNRNKSFTTSSGDGIYKAARPWSSWRLLQRTAAIALGSNRKHNNVVNNTHYSEPGGGPLALLTKQNLFWVASILRSRWPSWPR